MNKTSKQILENAIKTYGCISQQNKMIEEMAELTKAILKLRRGGDDPQLVGNVLEEMADVKIVLAQMEIMYGSPDEIVQQKVDRLAEELAA